MAHRHVRRGGIRSAVIAIGVLASVASARGDVDLNGPWAITFTSGPGLIGLSVVFDVTQVGTSISISSSDVFIGPISATGTIDPGTGLFSATGTANGLLCPTMTLMGEATADDALTGTFSCTNGISGAYDGGRCGNGIVDFAEECENVDCCDDTCQWKPAGGGCSSDGDSCTYDVCDSGHACTHPLAPAGTECAGDGIQCTDDVCDAGGVCTHPNDDTNPCIDGNDCTDNDACSAGVCSGVNSPVGAPCGADTNICTADTCDGAGTCVQGPCSLCCSPFGCVQQLWTGCARPTTPSSKLLMRRDGGANDRLQWKWTHGEQTDISEFGTPLSTTGYVLCVYGEDALSNPYLQFDAVVHGGGTCDGAPCWKAKSTGFSYKDDTQSSDGISRINLKAGSDGEAKILVKGKGANLKLQPIFMSDPATVQLRASNGQCWEAQYPSFRINGDDLRANKGQ